MTYLFFSQSLFILIGSMIAGLLIEQFSGNAVLLTGIIGITATLAAIPSCTTLTTLGTVLAVMGASMGIIDTTANVSMIRLFRTDVSPFLQALHFCYGIGAFLSPLIASPFLQNYDCDLLIDNSTMKGGEVSYIEKALRDEKPELKPGETHPISLFDAQQRLFVDDVFWIMAILQTPALVAVAAMMIKQRCECKYIPCEDTYEDIDGTPTKTKQPSRGFLCCLGQPSTFILLILFTGFFLFLADGMQASFGGMVYTYAKLAVEATDSSTAAALNAGFWGCFALGRLIAIGLALYLSPGFLLFLDLTGCLCSMFFMLLWPSSFGSLAIGTLLFGLSLSNVAPSAIATAEQFVEIGPSSTSFIVVCAAAGEALYPVLIGHLMDKQGTLVFLVAGNVSVCTMAVTYLVILGFGVASKKRSATQNWLKLVFPFAFSTAASKSTDEPGTSALPYGKLETEKEKETNVDHGYQQ